MTKKKPLKDLSLMNRFLFAEVMDNPEACQDMLSIILRKDIHLTSMPQTEKEHRVSPVSYTHLDVYKRQTVLRLLEPTEGQVFFEGKEYTALKDAELRKSRSELQIIFQDPYASRCV